MRDAGDCVTNAWKRIKFPPELDTSAFMTPELLQKVQPARDYARSVAEAKANMKVRRWSSASRLTLD